MNKTILVEHVNRPKPREQLISDFCRGKDVLDIGCVNHNIDNTYSDQWLHQSVVKVAKSCLGLDILEEEIKDLSERGFDVMAADATRPLEVARTFDVIVLGNLIEHLANFEGLLLNINRLLRPEGCVLVITPNPFYREQYFYSAFKNDILINPEHTCWIDPVALDQLVRRYGLSTRSVHWIKERWSLGHVILNGSKLKFNIQEGSWSEKSRLSVLSRFLRRAIFTLFRFVWPKKAKRLIDRLGARRVELLAYARSMGLVFTAFWRIYTLLIFKSPINRYELFMSVIRKEEVPEGGP